MKNVRNYRQEEEQEPDCSTCIRQRECSRFAENSYCTGWKGREPEPPGEDPNRRWKRGEEVDL